MSRLAIIAAGGTGGHMFPAQSLAEALLARGWRVTLSTDERGARYAGGFPQAVEVREVPSATFARGGLFGKISVPFRILSGVLAARRQMRRERPDVVIGFGGYPAIPATAVAWMLGLPRMIHEQNGVLGRVNQLFATRVNKVACGTWPTELPDGVEGIHTGNPVRAAILERAAAPYIPPGEYPMSVLVTGGSQGARILSDVVPEALSRLPEHVRQHLRVAHQAREEDKGRVEVAYAQAGIPATVESFFTDMPERMADAQLVIMRSGASTVADVSVIGRPSILVPLAAAIRDEQTANARGLVEAGAGIMMPESAFTPQALAEQVEMILSNPDAAMHMSQAALSAAKPDAADRLVSLVESLAEGASQ